MTLTVTVSQQWYPSLSSGGKFALEGNSKLLTAPVAADRILAARSKKDENGRMDFSSIEYLLQKGSGEDILFTWMPKSMMAIGSSQLEKSEVCELRQEVEEAIGEPGEE